jgi:hypothetical protein
VRCSTTIGMLEQARNLAKLTILVISCTPKPGLHHKR